MALILSGLDFHQAPVALREQLSVCQEGLLSLLSALHAQPGVEGCALLATCNRTEIYLTGSPQLPPWQLLCRQLELDPAPFAQAFSTCTGNDAARHLMEVACGLHSQILGDDQILTQVRQAIQLAQQAGTADPTLSALFRQAVTAGKRAKTQVQLPHAAPSMASRCCQVLEQTLQGLAGTRILVIGNGQMGRLTATLLRQAGAQVWVTLRSYRHGQTVIPAGCSTVPYEQRCQMLSQVDAIVSATTSPHYTLTRQQLEGVNPLPRAVVDLAVPRDIDPACRELLPCFDADSLGRAESLPQTQLEQIRAIAQEELEKFIRWQARQALPSAAPRFPLFLDLTGKTVVLIGGGTIAARRIAVLSLFGCQVEVVSPTLKGSGEHITWHPRPYQPGDLEGAFLAVAATDSREVNHQVYLEARQRGIPISVADCAQESTFYFPAICLGQDVIAGVVSTGTDHHKTARAAKALRKTLEELK